MRYIEGLTSKEGGYNRTGARSPMQWDDSKNAGFSTADADKLYIPIDPDASRPNAKAQIEDMDSLRAEVKKLIAVRQAHKPLQNLGDIEFISDGSKGKPLAYIRSFENEKILVVINPSNDSQEISLKYKVSDIVYRFGKEPEIKGDSIKVNGGSALFAAIC
jgi:maltose alpha-D-glucosyltransferase/alpha-amylase